MEKPAWLTGKVHLHGADVVEDGAPGCQVTDGPKFRSEGFKVHTFTFFIIKKRVIEVDLHSVLEID